MTIDWTLPIETDEEVPQPLQARGRLEREEMRWVQVVGGEEGWDGWYVKDDGQPKFAGVSGGPAVRNRTTAG